MQQFRMIWELVESDQLQHRHRVGDQQVFNQLLLFCNVHGVDPFLEERTGYRLGWLVFRVFEGGVHMHAE